MTNKHRRAGREYCNTSGSAHYKTDATEPLDLIIALGLQDGFCLGSIIKYASRFKNTRNLDDLKKVSDYAHILCGVELEKSNDKLHQSVIDDERDELAQHADKLKAYCAAHQSPEFCRKCNIGRNAGSEHISCRQFAEFYPDEALRFMGEAHDETNGI